MDNKIKTLTLIAITVTLGLSGFGCSKSNNSSTNTTSNGPTTTTQKLADGATVTTQTWDNGASLTTTTYADGSWTEQGVTAGGEAYSGYGGPYTTPMGGGPTVIGIVAESVDQGTKDVDLQRADLQSQNLDNEAQSLAGQFGMSFENARQLAQLSDKMQALGESGAVSDEDREAIANSALSVAGIKSEDVNQAIAQMVKDGDQKALNDLIEQAAQNLGMPSSAGLRDQLLPSLGIHI